jgi:hypothetical protein
MRGDVIPLPNTPSRHAASFTARTILACFCLFDFCATAPSGPGPSYFVRQPTVGHGLHIWCDSPQWATASIFCATAHSGPGPSYFVRQPTVGPGLHILCDSPQWARASIFCATAPSGPGPSYFVRQPPSGPGPAYFVRQPTVGQGLHILCHSPQWARAFIFTKFRDHTQRRTTVGRTPLGK